MKSFLVKLPAYRLSTGLIPSFLLYHLSSFLGFPTYKLPQSPIFWYHRYAKPQGNLSNTEEAAWEMLLNISQQRWSSRTQCCNDTDKVQISTRSKCCGMNEWMPTNQNSFTIMWENNEFFKFLLLKFFFISNLFKYLSFPRTMCGFRFQ